MHRNFFEKNALFTENIPKKIKKKEDVNIENHDREKSASGDDTDANKPLKQNDNNNNQAIGKVDNKTIDTNIKQAYKSRDAEKSRQFHEKKLAMKKTKSDGSIDENDLVIPLQGRIEKQKTKKIPFSYF